MENTSSLLPRVLNQDGFFIFRVGTLIAMYLSETGRMEPAINLFHECVHLLKSMRADIRDILLLPIYKSIGGGYYTIGDLNNAIKYMKLSVEMEEKNLSVLSSASLWQSYGLLGQIYHDAGDFRNAIESKEKALGYANGTFQKGRLYIDLSNIYIRLRDTEKAFKYVLKAKEIAKEGKTPQLERDCEFKESLVLAASGNYTKAIAHYEKVLAMCRKTQDSIGECRAYGQLGKMYSLTYDPKKALDNHLMALRIAKEERRQDLEKEQNYCIALNYLELGDYENALDYCELALAIPCQLGSMNWEIATRSLMGVIQERANDLKGAIDSYEQGVECCEEIEQRLGDKDDYKVSISEVHFAFFRFLTRALINDSQEVRALLTADRGRTRALADLMTLNYGIKADYVSHCKWLSIEDIQHIRQMTSRKSTFLITAINEPMVYLWHLTSDGSITLRQIQLMTKKLNNDYIRSLVDISCKELQEGNRQAGEECEDRSLPQRQDQINLERFPSGRTASDDLLWRAVKRMTSAEDLSDEKEAPLESTGPPMRVLYDLIVAPMADLLDQVNEEDAAEELVFAPDGPLCLLPFSALQGPDGKCLIDKYRIRVISSLTTLNQILTSPADYHNNTGALIVGDPDVGVVEYDGKLTNISRLPCAKTEAKRIAKLLKVKPLTGHKATKEEVLKRMTSVSLIHLAAHGNPKSGEIALAPISRVRDGPTEEKDYILSMADVQSIKLTAKLVVLSCCHSGRGDVKPEGVVGIARAFLGAGARSVLVSLWAINDAATLYFMCHFYKHLVQGKSASVALHQATKELKNSEEFSEARHWAPFMLIGDDVQISISDEKECNSP